MQHLILFVAAFMGMSLLHSPNSHVHLDQVQDLLSFQHKPMRSQEMADAWSGLSTGLNGTCLSLVVDKEGNIYAGGAFSEAGGIAANNIAMWDGNEWSALGEGLDNDCLALDFDSEGNLYAGGIFENAGGAPASRIAVWDGESWSALGAGLDAACRALAIDENDNVYAGGIFLNAGGTEASRIAVWNGSNWSGLDRGLAGAVDDIAIDSEGNVFAVGNFTITPPPNLLLNRVAKWEVDNTRWVALGSGLEGGAANAVAIDSADNIYVAGGFNVANGVAANRIAKWDGENFTPLGDGLDDTVLELKMGSDGNLYAGGFFEESDGSPGNHIARWDGENWIPLGQGLNSLCFAIETNPSGTVYAGGGFFQAGGMDISRIARYGDAVVSTREAGIAAQIKAYPNPTSQEVRVEGFQQRDNIPVWIINSSGATIRQEVMQSQTVNMSGLPNGIYYLEFLTEGRRAIVKVEVLK